jgi:hypothetical protein
MSEWWTYELSDFLLFSARTYYRLFELYNREIWPAQILGLLAGVAILVLLRKPGAWHGRAISLLLAACWLWVAWAYHYIRYSSINWVAAYFAIAFAVEATLLAVVGLAVRPPAPWITWTGTGLVVFAFVVQPLIGPLVGRSWSQVAAASLDFSQPKLARIRAVFAPWVRQRLACCLVMRGYHPSIRISIASSRR